MTSEIIQHMAEFFLWVGWKTISCIIVADIVWWAWMAYRRAHLPQKAND